MKFIRQFGPIPALFFAVALLVVHLSAQSGEKAPERKNVPLPAELVDHVRQDLESPDCVKESGEGFEQQIRVEQIDLTKGTSPAVLVTGLGPCLVSPAGNAPFLIYSHFGNSWRKILHAEGQTLAVLSTTQVGWHELEVNYRDSGSKLDRYVYRFSKNEYTAVSCETSTTLMNSDKAVTEPCKGWKPAK